MGMAVGNRDKNAHDDPPNVTFRELEDAFKVATEVVNAAKLALDG